MSGYCFIKCRAIKQNVDKNDKLVNRCQYQMLEMRKAHCFFTLYKGAECGNNDKFPPLCFYVANYFTTAKVPHLS